MAVLLEPEGDFDHLIAAGGRRTAALATLGLMDDPEPDFGLHPAVSSPEQRFEARIDIPPSMLVI